ncbi:MAG: B12-binding domain-containing radical SAM protein, partial [Thermodesulfobacteriota bacterium]
MKLCSQMAMRFPPTGLLYVGGALRKAGYEVELLHITPEEVQESVKKIVQMSPLFVGFSVFTGDAMRAHGEMCREIKRLSRIPIVWGNVHPSLLPEQCLNESYIDIVVIGEGEVTAVDLSRILEINGNLSEVLGIGYKVNGEVRINPPRHLITNLDQYPIDWSLVDVQRYISPAWEMKRMLPLVTSRGCPYRCTFCYNIKFNQRQWRSHSVDFVVTHISELKKRYELDGIFYHDDNFFVDKKRAFEILRRINLSYYAECRVELINDKFANQLAETGCKGLLVGLESGSDRILKMIQKDSTVDNIYRAAEALSKHPSVCLHGSTIMAYPTETREEFNDTLQMINRVFELHPNTNFTTGFYLPYPGGELYDLAIKEGFSPPSRTEDWELLDRWEA